MKPDLFEAPDYYNLDELLSEEHKLIRNASAFIFRPNHGNLRKWCVTDPHFGTI